MSLIANYSIEKLTHFQCTAPGCGKWWSIGDAPIDRHYFCPWCGELHFGCRETPPNQRVDDLKYYDADDLKGASLKWPSVTAT